LKINYHGSRGGLILNFGTYTFGVLNFWTLFRLFTKVFTVFFVNWKQDEAECRLGYSPINLAALKEFLNEYPKKYIAGQLIEN
jgi:hypothetical protein